MRVTCYNASHTPSPGATGGLHLTIPIRLLGYAAADGARNMAIDEALLDLVAAGESPLTLRFYGWSRPCVSLGCAQPYADLDLAACRAADLPIVRRASGGTAVLHESAIGFSLAIPARSNLAIADIVESYRVLGDPVHRALLALGVDGRLVAPEEAHRGGRPTGLGAAACFASFAPYEVTLGGRKIVGTSQVRRRGATLHHVMIPLAFDAARFAGLLAVGSEGERRVLSAYLDARVGGIVIPSDALNEASMTPACLARLSREIGGRTDTVPGERVADVPPVRRGTQADALVAALVEAFAAGLDLAPEDGSLTNAETVASDRLVATKYTSDEWTYRR